MENNELDLFQLLAIVKKYTKLITYIVVAAVFMTGVITYFFIQKKYQSTTVFFIHEKGTSGALSALSSQLGVLGGLIPGGITGGNNAALCEEIVKSRKLIGEVLSEKGIPSEPKEISKFKKESLFIKTKDSGAIQLSVLWTDPKMAFELTQTFFDKYKKVIEENVHLNSSSNRAFVEEQFFKSEERLRFAEDALVAYQKQNGLVLLPEQAKAEIEHFAELEKQIVEVEMSLSEAQRSLIEAEEIIDKESPMIKSTMTESLNPILQQYRIRLTDIEAELVEAQEKYTDNHPTVIALRARRDDLLKKIESETTTILSSETLSLNPTNQAITGRFLEGKIKEAGLAARKKALEDTRRKYDKMINDLPDQMLSYGRLLREQKVAEQIYTLLISQLEQAKIAEAKEENISIQVIDPPVVPHRKHSPSTVINMAIAGFMALFIGIGWAFLKEYWDSYKISNGYGVMNN